MGVLYGSVKSAPNGLVGSNPIPPTDFLGRLIRFKTAGGKSLEIGRITAGQTGVTILSQEANDS